jgi:hypothetical protein
MKEKKPRFQLKLTRHESTRKAKEQSVYIPLRIKEETYKEREKHRESSRKWRYQEGL